MRTHLALLLLLVSLLFLSFNVNHLNDPCYKDIPFFHIDTSKPAASGITSLTLNYRHESNMVLGYKLSAIDSVFCQSRKFCILKVDDCLLYRHLSCRVSSDQQVTFIGYSIGLVLARKNS